VYKRQVKPDENAFFAGARLTNEEQYLVQKLARYGAKTNNISTFHYVGRGSGYRYISESNTPFTQLAQASRIYLFGTEINFENAVGGFLINNLHQTKGIPVDLISTDKNNRLAHKCNSHNVIKDYYYFIKAVNHYLLSKGLQNAMFIKDHCQGFDEYKSKLLAEKFEQLIEKGCCCKECVIEFAENFNKEMNAVLVFAEKHVTSNTAYEIRNLCMITGKLGKTAMGMIALKEKNNSQGLYDMGICGKIGVGTVPITDEKLQQRMIDCWNTKDISTVPGSTWELMTSGKLKNLFIFGEDPLGCAIDKKQVSAWIKTGGFVLVQDYFMTETAQAADLVMPASWLAEMGGSYTNAQRVIQMAEVAEGLPMVVEQHSIAQLLALLNGFGKQKAGDVHEVNAEMISLLADPIPPQTQFTFTETDSRARLFDYGCDNINKRFEEYFNERMLQKLN
jgi:formate dehydrogenase major subunit